MLPELYIDNYQTKYYYIMYLAPLNYDRFFRKVFKDSLIAKRFLEDFLDVEIETIEKLDEKHRVTDDAAVV